MTKPEATRRDRTVPVRGRSARQVDSQVLGHAEVATEANSQSGACIPDSPPLNVRRPLLADKNDQDSDRWSEECVVPIVDGRTKAYSDWWLQQIVGPDNHSLFHVQLVGDASTPQRFTFMAQNDLAYFRYACNGCLSLAQVVCNVFTRLICMGSCLH